MTMQDHRPLPAGPASTRRQFLRAASFVGMAAALAGHAPLAAWAAEPQSAAACGASEQDLLNVALTIERATTTFYYTGLTSTPIVSNPNLADAPATVTTALGGTSAHVANLRAALDQEQKHAQILANAGATSRFAHFYFPAEAFQHLGFTSHAGTFLWLLDQLETASIAFYVAAVQRFGVLGRSDLAVLATRHLAVQCEHRALGRVIAHDDPSDNVTLPVDQFTCVDDVMSVFDPYLTGRGSLHGIPVTRAIALPAPAETARIIGKNTST